VLGGVQREEQCDEPEAAAGDVVALRGVAGTRLPSPGDVADDQHQNGVETEDEHPAGAAEDQVVHEAPSPLSRPAAGCPSSSGSARFHRRRHVQLVTAAKASVAAMEMTNQYGSPNTRGAVAPSGKYHGAMARIRSTNVTQSHGRRIGSDRGRGDGRR